MKFVTPRYSGFQVFSKTKPHENMKKTSIIVFINNTIIGLKLHGYTQLKTTENLNTRIPLPSPHGIQAQAFPRSKKNIEMFFPKHLTRRF